MSGYIFAFLRRENVGHVVHEIISRPPVQRFNVAVTRARSLLIVVGNHVILNKDPTWAK